MSSTIAVLIIAQSLAIEMNAFPWSETASQWNKPINIQDMEFELNLLNLNKDTIANHIRQQSMQNMTHFHSKQHHFANQNQNLEKPKIHRSGIAPTMPPKNQTKFPKRDDFYDIEIEVTEIIVKYNMIVRDKNGTIIYQTENDATINKTKDILAPTSLYQQCEASLFGEFSALFQSMEMKQYEKEIKSDTTQTSNKKWHVETTKLSYFLNQLFDSQLGQFIDACDGNKHALQLRLQQTMTKLFACDEQDKRFVIMDDQCSDDDLLDPDFEMKSRNFGSNQTCSVKYNCNNSDEPRYPRINVVQLARFTTNTAQQNIHHFLKRIDTIQVYHNISNAETIQINKDRKHQEAQFLSKHNITSLNVKLMPKSNLLKQKFARLGPVHYVLRNMMTQLMSEFDQNAIENGKSLNGLHDIDKKRMLVAMKVKENELSNKLYFPMF